MHDSDMQLEEQKASRLRSAAGITIVEVLITTSLALLTLATFTSFNRFQLHSLRNQATQNRVQMTARNAVDLLHRDIRRAGRNPTCAPGIEAIAQARRRSIRILSDHDGNGAADGPEEDVTYRFTPSTDGLERVANGEAEVVFEAMGRAESVIRYFDVDGVQLDPGTTGLAAADRARVQRIRIDVALQTNADDPRSGPPLRADLTADVDLRNRFFVNGISCP
jgi:type II secretory pathway component PulJ